MLQPRQLLPGVGEAHAAVRLGIDVTASNGFDLPVLNGNGRLSVEHGLFDSPPPQPQLVVRSVLPCCLECLGNEGGLFRGCHV